MRWLTNGSKYCDQCGSGACQDCADERESSERLFEKKGRKSGVKDEAGLEVLAKL
jgi:hypothetical protein